MAVGIVSAFASLWMAQSAVAQTNFCRAILTKQAIVLNGGIVIDSFNSLDPAQSTNGRYDPAKRQDGGDIASASDSVKTITENGSGRVYGHVATGPNGTVVTTGNASMGSLAWVDGGNRGVQPGWYANNVNVLIPDAQLPAVTFVPMPTTRGTVNGTSYTYVLGSGNYRGPLNFSLSGSQNMVIHGKVVLYFPGSFHISGSAYVYITPGSSLTLYLGGDTQLSGGGIVNGTGFATNCAYFGLPSCLNIDNSGGSSFTGTIYAPQADVKLSGGGNSVANFAGAVVAKSATLTGNYQFHYDEGLCRPDNRPPVANNDSYTTPEDTTLTIAAPGVLANDSDPDGNVLRALLASNPAHGTLAFNTNGAFVYTPSLNYNGLDTFTYRATDGSLTSGVATVTITITPVNDAPVAANDDFYTTPEDTTLTIAAPGILANDLDVDGDPLRAVLVSSVSHGTLNLNANGAFVYTPSLNYTGLDTFTYRATDGSLTSGVATVTITITPLNDPPIARDDSYITPSDTTLTIAAPGVLVNDSDVDGDALTALLVGGATRGTVTLSGNGSFVYVPNARFSGTDTFTYRANDGKTNSNLATVTITVQPSGIVIVTPPRNQTNCPGETATFSVTATGTALTYQWIFGTNVLANRTNSTLVLTNVSLASAGTYCVVIRGASGGPVTNCALLVVNQNVIVTTPPANQTACPGSTVLFHVSATGTALTYQWYFGAAALTGQTSSTLVLSNVAAANAGTYIVVVSGACGAPVTNSATLTVNQNVIVTTPPVSQTSFVGSNVVFSVTATGTGLSYRWVFNGQVVGTNSTLTINNLTTNQAGSYCVMVSGVCGIPMTVCTTLTIQNRPPIARDDSYTTPSDTTLTIAAPGVLANDSDLDGDALTALLVGAPTRGTVTLSANGSFIYVPNAGFGDVDTFTYRANDGKTNSNLATVTITVRPSGIVIVTPPKNQTNCPGETATFSVTATGTALRYQWLFGGNPLANQTNSTLVLVNVSATNAGTYCVVLTGAGSGPITNCALLVVNQNVIVTTPPANQTVCPGGTANFHVTATGTALTYQWYFGTTLLIGEIRSTLILSNVIASQAGTYRVIVMGACGAPVTNSATLTVSQNVIVTTPPVSQTSVVGSNVVFSVTATGTGLSYRWVFNGQVVGTNSTLTLNNITANQAGIYCVAVSGACGNPVTNCATLTIQNRPPIARDDAYTTPEDTILVIAAPGILANDSDPDGDALTAVLGTSTTHGTLILSNNGSFIYRPFTNFAGEDTFLYRANDGAASSSPAVVRIKVEPRPDAPIARDDSYTTPEDTTLVIAAPGVLANDIDVDGDALSSVLVNGTANGTLMLSANGSFIYVPNTGYNGPDSFTYKASDGSLESGVATVRITVTPVNDPPTVIIVSPTNGSTYIAPANYSVIADANDSDGVVTNVQIFSGTNLIGTFTNAPYFVPQTNLPPGIYTYFATATDNDGLRATSSVVIVTVTSSPPVTALGPIVLNRQNGLFEQFVRVNNPTPQDFPNGMRVFAELFSDNPSNRVWNASGTNTSGVAFVDSPTPLPSGGSIDVLIQYYLPEPRSVPTVTLTAVPLPFAQPTIPQPKVMGVSRSGGGAVIEFTTVKQCMYYLQCSDDLVHWTTIAGLTHGDGNPARSRDPGSAPSRFYKVIVIR